MTIAPQADIAVTGWRANDLHPSDVLERLHLLRKHTPPGRRHECWLWRGPLNPGGYGLLCRSGRAAFGAHRAAWVHHTGEPLTNALTIDHLCGRPQCVNPHHLEPVSLRENVRRKNLLRDLVRKDSEEGRAQQRAASLAYYYANREERLAHMREYHQRPEVQEAVKRRAGLVVTCSICSKEMRRDSLPKHRRRMHSAT